VTPSIDLDAYLNRIQWGGDVRPSYDTLAGLLRAHMLHIPFENLDVLLGRGIRIDLDSLQNKLVRARRGGYCFEHSTLLAAVLEQLGFQPVRQLARVTVSRPRTEMARTHMFLTVLLEEGQREQWFESPMIVWLGVIAVVGIGLLVAGQFRASKPIVKLRLLGNARYASVIVIVFTIGAGMYCMSYLLPQFLAGIAGYNAQQSGSIMLVYGVPAFLMAPILPQLLGRIDMRVMVIAGLLCFGASCLLDVALTAQSVGGDFIDSQLLRGVGQMMAMMPLNQASLGAAAKEDAGDAVGLYNMARNLGGSVGLALLGVLIDRRYAFHDAVIRESLSWNSPTGQAYLAATAQGLVEQHGDAVHAQLQALGQLAAQIQREAMVMTYSEAFHLLAVALLLCIPLACLLKRPAPGGAVSSGH